MGGLHEILCNPVHVNVYPFVSHLNINLKSLCEGESLYCRESAIALKGAAQALIFAT